MSFEVGSRIKVVKQKCYKTFDLIDEVGTVRSINGSKIGVNLDNIRNPNSSYGAFYIDPAELVLLNKNTEEIFMQNNISNYLNIAKIKFIDNSYSTTKTYEYANFEPNLTVGDICVVRSAHHGLGVAKVEEIIERNDVATQREIVAIVNTDAYEERVANRAKAAELKVKMQERVKQLQDVALYKMMAENDPTMMEMLKEYQSIIGM